MRVRRFGTIDRTISHLILALKRLQVWYTIDYNLKGPLRYVFGRVNIIKQSVSYFDPQSSEPPFA
jgi:hypothetical protein